MPTALFSIMFKHPTRNLFSKTSSFQNKTKIPTDLPYFWPKDLSLTCLSNSYSTDDTELEAAERNCESHSEDSMSDIVTETKQSGVGMIGKDTLEFMARDT